MTERPRTQLVLAFVVSVWVLAWVLGQAVAAPMSPLDVPRGVVRWAGFPVGWLDSLSDWARDPVRQWVFGTLAIVAGLLWTASTERAQLPASLGWLTLLVAAEGIGYHPAVFRAVLAMTGFVLLLALVAMPGKVSPLINRIVLVPRTVLRAGATAAALAALVPLLAPGLVVTRLLGPYVTRPAQRRATAPRPRSSEDNNKVPAQEVR